MRRDVGFLPWLWRGLLVAVAMSLCWVPSLAMAAEVGDTYTITYKTDAGHFSNGTDTNVVGYTVTGWQSITKYSHTANIDDDGTASGTYASNLSTTDVVTIPGAKSLTIDVWYSTGSTSYDWLAIYPARVTPSQGNSSQASVSGGKLGGGYAKTRDGATHVTYTVDGDTAQFYFRSDGYGNYYGYYAVVTGEGLPGTVTSGSYEEPTGIPDGWTWKGWFSDEVHTQAVDPSTLTSDATVYGHSSPYLYGHEGTCGTVSWGIKPSGELHFWPTNGTEGTLASNTQNLNDFWPWYQYRSSVKSITSEGTIHATGNLSNAFYNCSSLANVDGLASWDTSSVTSLYGAFYYCRSLANVDALSSWDTSSVTNLQFAFYNCSSLANVDGLASWDTSSVTGLSSAFYYCRSLANVDGLASWDTSHVTSLFSAFYGCSSLTSLDGLASWDTSSVTSLYEAFYDCSSLTSLSMKNWDTTNVTNANSMLYACTNLSVVTLGPKVTAKVIQQLPTPHTGSPYTGKWVRVDGYGPYTASELSNLSAADRVGTWVWDGTNLSPYVVSFDANGGTGSVASLQVSPFVGHVTIPDGSSLVRPSYDFAGWNTKTDGTGTPYLPGTVKAPIHNEATGKPAAGGDAITLYAIWKRESVGPSDGTGQFDVTLRANQQVTINDLPAGATYVITETPVPSGWTLVRSDSTTGIIMPTVV